MRASLTVTLSILTAEPLNSKPYNEIEKPNLLVPSGWPLAAIRARAKKTRLFLARTSHTGRQAECKVLKQVDLVLQICLRGTSGNLRDAPKIKYARDLGLLWNTGLACWVAIPYRMYLAVLDFRVDGPAAPCSTLR